MQIQGASALKKIFQVFYKYEIRNDEYLDFIHINSFGQSFIVLDDTHVFSLHEGL